MDYLGWAMYALAAAAALVVVGYFYQRRETPGRGRTLLALLRWAALAVLILLLFDPELPAPGFAAGGSRTRVLLDASLSMELPVEAGGDATRWDQAVDAARRIGGDVLLFGGTPRITDPDSLDALRPSASVSRLAPALRTASEAGDRRVIVLTDGGIEDAAEVERMLPNLGLEVEFRRLGSNAGANRGLVEVEARDWAEAGEPFEVRVGIAAVGATTDSVTVVLREGGQTRAEARVATPAPGRVASATLRLTPEPPPAADADPERDGGVVRYDIAFATADAAPADDHRTIYVFVSEEPTGIALVSFRPTWEPRFLQPVLAQALGLPVRGFLHTADDRFVTLGSGADAGRAASAADVRRAVAAADLVVLHGLNAGAPAWAREAAREARRVLVFPAGDATRLELPLTLPAAVPGDWYIDTALPSSPLAPLLADLTAERLPPLQGLHPAEPTAGAWAPLRATLGRQGATAPVLLADEQGDRRWAVALADGYWRWAFHGPQGRQIYRRLWAALGGWLVNDEAAVASAAVRPAERVVARGQPVRWLAPGLAADSVALHVASEQGTVVLDTVVRVRDDGAASSPALPPGHYRYSARAFAGGEGVANAEGPVTSASYSPDFTRAAASLATLAASADVEAREGTARISLPGEPLHTSPWPYLLFVLLVSTEWVLRRRWGLR